MMDEGLYLYKGYLFASGQYWPFQDYGPWTNHMPLSFLIPGFVQVWLGPGLRTGRYFALLLGILTILGVWVATRNLGGGWWGAAAVWTMAVNPAVIKIFSVSASQGLAACILVWALALTLGEGRARWQIVAGATLAGALGLTRINLTPIWVFVLGYVFWQHGKRSGAWATGASALVVGVGYTFFWPGILRMWAAWIPSSLSPFLNLWRRPPGATGVWNPEVDFISRLISFFQGIRFHFIALMGVFVSTLVLFRKGKNWHNKSLFRAAVFGISLFALLVILHAWAALGQSYCVFCFPVYLSFFHPLGIILLVIGLGGWKILDLAWKSQWIGAMILLLGAGIGFSAFDVIGAPLISQKTVRRILTIEVPRVRGLQIQEGNIELWGLIGNLFGTGYEEGVRQAQYYGRIAVSTLIGLLVAGFVLMLAAKGRNLFWRKNAPVSFGTRALLALLLVGMILSPTVGLGGGYHTYDCGGDVISAHERAGVHLREQVPPGSQIYWQTGDSPAPLLYLPEIEIYPAQLNGVYSFRTGGDPDSLEKFGNWNRSLAERWIEETDVVLIDRDSYDDPQQSWLINRLETSVFEERPSTPPPNPCENTSRIRIFVRKP